MPGEMNKRVLLAVDLEMPDSRAASYAVQLAARLKLSLVLMAVFPPRPGDPGEPGEISLSGLAEEQNLWLDKVRERCQQEGVSLEIFLAAGAFCDEILAFARAQSALQFIVLGWPEDRHRDRYPGCAEALKSLHQQIDGEILLVRGQGKVTRVMDL
jgi:nucleotide-binding universal stress UspA family protein